MPSPVRRPRRTRSLPPPEFILDALRGRAGKSMVLDPLRVDRPLARAARHYFGSVTRAIELAGVEPRATPAVADLARDVEALVASFAQSTFDVARRAALDAIDAPADRRARRRRAVR